VGTSLILLLFWLPRAGNDFSLSLVMVFSLPVPVVAVWAVSFSSPYFLFAPALVGCGTGAGTGLVGERASLIEAASLTVISSIAFFGSGLAGGILSKSSIGGGESLWKSGGLSGTMSTSILVGELYFTGSSSTKRETGGGPKSGESFESSAAAHKARISALLYKR
jgi:hypothetical protein